MFVEAGMRQRSDYEGAAHRSFLGARTALCPDYRGSHINMLKHRTVHTKMLIIWYVKVKKNENKIYPSKLL